MSLPLGITRVHALTGTVCLVDSSAIFLSNPCPSIPAVFSGPVGQQVRIGVFIRDSDGFNAFDITLLANFTFLKPAGIDLTDTLLNSATGPATTVLECLNGSVIVGTDCSSPDTAGTIHLAATTAPGAPLTTPPTTGVLFTAIFNITGTTPTAGIPLRFQTGCSQSSVSGGICLTIANGSGSPVPENIQTGTLFQNSGSATMAYVVISSSQTSFGPEFPGTTNTATITATSNNGYPPTSVTDAVNFTAITPASLKLSATLSPSSCSTSGSSCSTTLTLTGSAAGTYFATVYGTYATVDGSGNPDTLSSTITVEVIIADFGFSITPTTLSFISGEIGTTTATISSVNGFSGVVTLSVGTNVPSPGLSVSFSSNPVTLTPGQSLNSIITLQGSPTSQITYHTQIRATG